MLCPVDLCVDRQAHPFHVYTIDCVNIIDRYIQSLFVSRLSYSPDRLALITERLFSLCQSLLCMCFCYVFSFFFGIPRILCDLYCTRGWYGCSTSSFELSCCRLFYYREGIRFVKDSQWGLGTLSLNKALGSLFHEEFLSLEHSRGRFVVWLRLNDLQVERLIWSRPRDSWNYHRMQIIVRRINR